MNTTTAYRTARTPHLCEGCHWTGSLRGVPTILPGHRYIIHTTFPGAEAYEEGPARSGTTSACGASSSGPARTRSR